MKKLLPVFLLVLFFSFKIPPALAISESECVPDGINDARSSRPAPCNLCCPRTETITTSCATTFTLYKNISFPKNTSQEKIPWEVRFNVNVSETSLPFAGKAGEEDEINYLADYLEGTNEYYANYNDQTTITNYQGVLRKLTPLEYQNQLKKQLIARAPEKAEIDKENRIHNYEIVYVERVCWDFPFWMDAGEFVMEKLSNFALDSALERFNKGINKILSFFHIEKGIDIKANLNFPEIGHYCLYADYEKNPSEWLVVKINKIFHRMPVIGEIYDGLLKISKMPGLIHVSLNEGETARLTDFLAEEGNRLPPSPNEENYREKYLVWKEKDDGKWYRLWQAVPMISREDTPGEVRPYIGKDPNVTLIVDNEDNRLEKIPHLARLFESSQIINQLLVPKTNKEIEKQVSEDFPETNPPVECFKENYLAGEGDDICCGEIPGTIEGQFENPYFEECGNKTATPSAKCQGMAEEKIAQGIGVKLSHPYLDEIWHNTTYPLLGFFNIFRPHQITAFEDIDAASTIGYSGENEVSPEQGSFFFPHLGGIQKAKEWVVNQALWPYEKKL